MSDDVLRIVERAPVAGEELVGPPPEQERVGGLVGLADKRQGVVVEHPHGPAAALESAPAVLLRRAAVSLHHAVDGDLRHGRQLHGFVPSRVVVSRYDRTEARRSSQRRVTLPGRAALKKTDALVARATTARELLRGAEQPA